MPSQDRMLECPECRKLISARLLHDLNKCDNCGCHERFFKFCPSRPNAECMKTCPRENCLITSEIEILSDMMAGRDY